MALCLSATVAYAQGSSRTQGNTVVASGTVFGSDGEPLIGASVLEVGTTNGCTTDVDGKFQFRVAPKATIQIGYIGYNQATVAAGTNLKITLTESANMLDEVVAIGYGTAKKKDMTGAVVQVRPDDLQAQNPATVQDLLRGVAGMNVGITNDAKGGGSIVIRGNKSVGTGTNALLILDGMIFYGELSEINPDDIAQIDILKDASAAAVYGAQAANGVILITTKKGSKGAPVVRLTANIGFVKEANSPAYLGKNDYLQHKVDFFESNTYGFDSEGNYRAYQSGYESTPGYFRNPNNLPAGVSLSDWRGYTIQDDGMSDYEIWLRRINFKGDLLQNALNDNFTNWDDYFYQKGLQQDYNVSVSGANEKANYYLSAGYLHNKGVARGDYFRQFRMQMKVNMDVNTWLNVGAQINFQDRSDDARVADSEIRTYSPYANVKDEDGSWTQYPLGTDNAYGHKYTSTLYNLDWDKKEQGYTTFNTQFNIRVKLPFNITYTFNIAPRYQFYYKRAWYEAAKPDRLAKDSGVDRDMAKRFDWSLNNVLNWNKKFAGKHDVTVTLVQEAEERRYWSQGIGARNITPTDALGFHYIKSAQKDLTEFWTDDTHRTADGLLARGQYNFDNRYLLTASIRRDGYCAFGVNNQHATFPAFAAGWIFTNEKFWEPFSNVMDYGKLRLSWGQNGNRDIGADVALANLTDGGNARQQYITGNNVVTDYAYLRVDRLANPNLKWERTESFNVGLDFSFMHSRLTGALELYYAKTKDMIMSQRLPGFSGYENITTNLGQVDNKGIELSLRSTNIQNRNFTWTTDFTFAYNHNEIKHLTGDRDENGKEVDNPSNGWFIGHSIGEIWNFKYMGIWQVNEAEEAAKYGQRPGDIKVWNNPANDVYNEDGTVKTIVYNDEDKCFLGQSNAPYRLTMRNNFTIFKNFNVSFTMYSYLGYKGYQSVRGGDVIRNNDDDGAYIQFRMVNTVKKPYWTPEHPINNAGRMEAKGPTGAGDPHRYVNRSFLRFSNISVSYALPTNLLKNIQVDDLKVFVSVDNLGTITGKNWNASYGDPENWGRTNRKFNIGLSAQF